MDTAALIAWLELQCHSERDVARALREGGSPGAGAMSFEGCAWE